MPTAIVIGASTGIGLAICRRLVGRDWTVTGLARSATGLDHARYRHVVADVRAPSYRDLLASACESVPDLCIYAAGIGHELDVTDLARG